MIRSLRSFICGPNVPGRRYRPQRRMYRFLLRPRWLLFHLACVAAVFLMINLGFWQLRRLDERRDFNARVEARIDQPAQPLDDVLAAGTPDQLEWRQVTASGQYLPEEQVLIVNRSQTGRAGDIVMTPLLLADDRVLLVERGFAPLGAELAPPPAGTVEIVGRLRPSEERRRGQLSDSESGELQQAQRLDIDRLAAQLPVPAVAMYVELVESQPTEAGAFPEPLPPPELGEGPHLSYAGQWFIFSAGVVVGWVLAIRHSVRTRRAAASDARRDTAASSAGDVEPATEVVAAPPSSPR
jgi:cytochrome oxidase assembly protein ShyY1